MAAPKTHQHVDWNKYALLSEDNPKSIVWASRGSDGSGKSDFALSAPGPIWIAAFDTHGMNRVRRERKAGKEIRVVRYPFTSTQYKSKEETSKAATAVWHAFVDDYRVALLNARTVVWDREDLAWELLRYASLGGSSATPSAYADLNIEYVSLIQEAFAAGKNLGLLQGLREQWISKFDPTKGKMVGHNTGEWIPDGMKKVADHVDITLTHRWDADSSSFVTRIDKFTNKIYKGAECPDFDFVQMGMAAYDGTTEEEWS